LANVDDYPRPVGHRPVTAADIGDVFPRPIRFLEPTRWHPKGTVGHYVQNRLIEWNWWIRDRLARRRAS
jgi:hypothetical protein